MKKLTAMLLSLVMCFSLLAIPAQAAFIPAPGGSGIVDAGGLKGAVNPGDDDSDEPGISVQGSEWPYPEDDTPKD